MFNEDQQHFISGRTSGPRSDQSNGFIRKCKLQFFLLWVRVKNDSQVVIIPVPQGSLECHTAREAVKCLCTCNAQYNCLVDEGISRFCFRCFLGLSNVHGIEKQCHDGDQKVASKLEVVTICPKQVWNFAKLEVRRISMFVFDNETPCLISFR